MRTGILDTGIIPVSVGPAGIPVSRLPTGIGQRDKVVMGGDQDSPRIPPRIFSVHNVGPLEKIRGGNLPK